MNPPALERSIITRVLPWANQRFSLCRRLVALWAVLLGTAAPLWGTASADERLTGVACRSVHLGYAGAPGQAFYCEVTVERSAPGTYFCVCGWNKGYFGLQELAGGQKLLIFSVWDSMQDESESVDPKQRVKLLHQHADVRVGRFGGEGTGGQSFLDYDWRVGTTYRLLVSAAADGPRTAYSGYFYHPERAEWLHLITFSTIADSPHLRGYYSFVEDFQRNRISATFERRAQFGPAWRQATTGEWAPLVQARFTADSNRSTNIDAGSLDARFFLSTGGAVQNNGTALNQSIELPDPQRAAPADLPPLFTIGAATGGDRGR